MYRGASKTMAPEEISALVLAKMRDIAVAKLGVPVTKAVVTGAWRRWDGCVVDACDAGIGMHTQQGQGRSGKL
jgi:hypothetical protein